MKRCLAPPQNQQVPDTLLIVCRKFYQEQHETAKLVPLSEVVLGRKVGDKSTATVCDVQDPPLSHVVHRLTKVFSER